MNRYHVIDTTTGHVVREQRTLYGQPIYKRPRERLLSPHEQDLVIFCFIGVVIGGIIF